MAAQLALVEVARTPAAPERDLAYAAGFFDGEGCVSIGRQWRWPTYRLLLSVANNDRRPLDWLQSRWNGTVVLTHRKIGNLADAYQWRATGPTAGRFLGDIRPYLQIKGEAADNALEFLAVKAQYEGRGRNPTPPEALAAQKRHYVRSRDLIPRIRASWPQNPDP